jgi:hypothetical protein
MTIRSRRRPLTRTPADVGLDYISERADEVVGFFRANL